MSGDGFTWTRDLRNLFEAVKAEQVTRRPDGADWRASPGGDDSLTGRKCGRALKPLKAAGFVTLLDPDGAWPIWETTPAGDKSYAEAPSATAFPVSVRVDEGAVR